EQALAPRAGVRVDERVPRLGPLRDLLLGNLRPRELAAPPQAVDSNLVFEEFLHVSRQLLIGAAGIRKPGLSALGRNLVREQQRIAGALFHEGAVGMPQPIPLPILDSRGVPRDLAVDVEVRGVEELAMRQPEAHALTPRHPLEIAEVAAELDVLIVVHAGVAVDADAPGIHRLDDLADFVLAERPGQVEPGAFGAETGQDRFDFQRHHALRSLISKLSISGGTLALQGRALAVRDKRPVLVERAV